MLLSLRFHRFGLFLSFFSRSWILDKEKGIKQSFLPTESQKSSYRFLYLCFLLLLLDTRTKQEIKRRDNKKYGLVSSSTFWGFLLLFFGILLRENRVIMNNLEFIQ